MKKTVNNATVEGVEETAQGLQDVIDMISKEYQGTLISEDEVEKLGYDKLIKWLTPIAKYGNFKRSFLFVKGEDFMRVIFFTSDYKYFLRAKLPHRSEGYLSCIMSCRKERPGEVWTRGSDMPDGKYNKKTFDRIINAVVKNEMKHLQCFDRFK